MNRNVQDVPLAEMIDKRVARVRNELLARLIIFIAFIVAMTIVTLLMNGSRSLPVFVFLALLAAGLSMQLNVTWNLALSAVMIVLWIYIERLLGLWTRERMWNNLAEMAGILFMAISGGFFYERLMFFIRQYIATQVRQMQLETEDKTTNLLRAPIGKLRLEEEVDRAFQHHVPISLLLLQIQPASRRPLSDDIRVPVFQSVATFIKDMARETDIPFLLESDLIALIMPDTDIQKTQKAIDHFSGIVREGSFLLPSGKPAPLDNYVLLRFGFATFLGRAQEPPDLLAAAKKSLDANIEANQGVVFQNLFLDWVTIGEYPDTNSMILENNIT